MVDWRTPFFMSPPVLTSKEHPSLSFRGRLGRQRDLALVFASLFFLAWLTATARAETASAAAFEPSCMHSLGTMPTDLSLAQFGSGRH
jgi:hypothetical protein